MLSLKSKKHIYFSGIGGIGISAIAEILSHAGHKIEGSDLKESVITKKFEQRGIHINRKQIAKNIHDKLDIFIFSPAISEKNPERKEAEKRGIKCLSYPQALGALSKKFYLIAIAGTHGKSTTTAMSALVLENLDPTVIIGTKVKEFDNENFRIGKSKYLIVEACEYKESFKYLTPDILIITNIEADHLDHYGTPENYFKAFKKLALRVPPNGFIIAQKSNRTIQKAIKNAKAKKILWEKFDFDISPGVAGNFNLQNASQAATLGLTLGIEKASIQKSLKSFCGTWRRMEKKSTSILGTEFIDDYGHHPTEIRLTLEEIRNQNPDKRILCVFQPHQYNRTHQFLKDFGKSFSSVDAVIVPNIYKVRDTKKDILSVCAETLIEEINKNSKNAKYGKSLENTAEIIKNTHNEFDLIITMGAGDIADIYDLI